LFALHAIHRETREEQFTTAVENVVTRGGSCLIPVFALGRAQELLLILDEYWQGNPRLQVRIRLAQKPFDVFVFVLCVCACVCVCVCVCVQGVKGHSCCCFG
jgi:hypothetical protein